MNMEDDRELLLSSLDFYFFKTWANFTITSTIICFPILMGADTSPHPKETNKQNIWCTAVFDNLALLGTVTQLFIPSSVHLYTDQPASGLLWTEIV